VHAPRGITLTNHTFPDTAYLCVPYNSHHNRAAFSARYELNLVCAHVYSQPNIALAFVYRNCGGISRVAGNQNPISKDNLNIAAVSGVRSDGAAVWGERCYIGVCVCVCV